MELKDVTHEKFSGEKSKQKTAVCSGSSDGGARKIDGELSTLECTTMDGKVLKTGKKLLGNGSRDIENELSTLEGTSIDGRTLNTGNKPLENGARYIENERWTLRSTSVDGKTLHSETGSLNTTEKIAVIHITEGDSEQDESISWSWSSPKIKKIIRYTTMGTAFILYCVFFGFAMALNFDRAVPLLVFTLIGVALSAHHLIGRWFKSKSWTKCNVNSYGVDVGQTELSHRQDLPSKSMCMKRFSSRCQRFIGKTRVRIAFYSLVLLAMFGYPVSQHRENLDRLRPLAGLVSIIFLSWLLSYNRTQINWRPVVWGLAMQMCLGIVTMTTGPGRHAFQCLGKQVEAFLDHVLAGVLFVFGEKYADFFFIFKLMPIVIFLSSALSCLYHVGVMQTIVGGVASVMSVTMATTATESTGTAACIFLGQPEASLTIKPFLSLMTRSELFAITTAGFSSVTADVFAIFVNYGMPSAHIITAVIMSAPASIAVSKVICPEVEESQTKNKKQIRQYERNMTRHKTLLDAAASGAHDAVAIIVSVVASIIAFLSILSLINSVIAYVGGLVNITGLSLEKMLSYPLIPVAYLLGVNWADCGAVAEVIALKTFVNELVGYQRLDEIVKAGGITQRRSEIIAMYALCGFSNPTTVGITLGGLSTMAPSKKEVISSTILMSWLAGCLACFMTSAWAGLLYSENDNFVTNSTLLSER